MARRASTRTSATRPRPRGGLPDKRRAILAGAHTVFSRDGFTRASIDAIAAEAAVSTRTIYNHFSDKGELFFEVIKESSDHVAEAQIAVIERHLYKVTDLEADLTALGRAWLEPDPEQATHFVLTQHIAADAAHIPDEIITAWQEAGPVRVRRALATHMRDLMDRGLLRDGDEARAAYQFLLLIQATNPSTASVGTPSDDERTEAVAAGVQTFLYGHAGPRHRRRRRR